MAKAAKPPVSSQIISTDQLELQTWILRVYIHCEGCKKKVFKLLQSIDGVYKTVIDSKQHKATVTGSVNGETLVQKLLKSGKHAEILPESYVAPAAADSAPENPKTKGDETEHAGDEKEESEDATSDGSNDGNDQEITKPAVVVAGDGNGNGDGGGKKKKNKKKKSEKNENNSPPNGDTEGLPTDNAPADTGLVTENARQLNLGRPNHQMVYASPYDLPPYHNYYPTPAYGMSYNTSYPSAGSSYYTPPVYGIARSHPSVYYPPPPPPSYYRRSAFDDDDYENEGRVCSIM